MREERLHEGRNEGVPEQNFAKQEYDNQDQQKGAGNYECAGGIAAESLTDPQHEGEGQCKHQHCYQYKHEYDPEYLPGTCRQGFN